MELEYSKTETIVDSVTLTHTIKLKEDIGGPTVIEAFEKLTGNPFLEDEDQEGISDEQN